MKNYTGYEFYKNTYLGNMPEERFNKAVIEASTEVRKAIMGKNILGHEEEVQMATCSVADIINSIDILEKKKTELLSSEKRIIASEQVGNVSKTFAGTTSIKEIDQEISNLKKKISAEIEEYLLFTGLLYRGVAHGRFI